MYSDKAPDFAAASDGDGDRYMILGRKFFLNPSDSLAILTQYLDDIPFYQGRVSGVARSMPTSFAVDYVASDKGIKCYQTPTGWKFFGNLITADKIAICGEESFGGGSFHLQEKDGIWAVLCWLTILAKTGKTVEEITRELWGRYGRVFAILHNYDGLDKKDANLVMEKLTEKLPSLIGQEIQGEMIQDAFVFNYTDPVSSEVSPNQGICISFLDDSRLIFRLSGTSSVGATFKIYMNKRLTNSEDFNREPTDVLQKLSEIAREISELKHLTKREKPDTIT
jgi:phosphoglucomutase